MHRGLSEPCSSPDKINILEVQALKKNRCRKHSKTHLRVEEVKEEYKGFYFLEAFVSKTNVGFLKFAAIS